MCKMEYLYLVDRLNTIRIDIKELRQRPTTSIKEKIQILKETNSLLREQNRLLLQRQALLTERRQQELRLKAS